jgi:hypothetical protein
MVISGAKAHNNIDGFTARLKSCPDTCDPETITARVLPQRLKPALIAAGAAGLKACSTPRGTANGNSESNKACSTPWGKNSPGLKPHSLKRLYAALKGRSSTVQLCAANSLRSPLPEGKGWGRSSTLQSATTGVR